MPVKCYIWNTAVRTGWPLLQMKILHSRPQYYNNGRFKFCCWLFLSSVGATLSFQAPIQFVASTIKDHLRPNVVHIPLSSTPMIIDNDDDHAANVEDLWPNVARLLSRLIWWWLWWSTSILRCWWWWFWRSVTKCCSSRLIQWWWWWSTSI